MAATIKAVVLIYDKQMVPFALGQSHRGTRMENKRPKAIKLKIVGNFNFTQLGTLIEQLATLKNEMEVK